MQWSIQNVLMQFIQLNCTLNIGLRVELNDAVIAQQALKSDQQSLKNKKETRFFYYSNHLIM